MALPLDLKWTDERAKERRISKSRGRLSRCIPFLVLTPEYCPLGRSFDSSCTNYRTGDASFHHAPVCSTRLLYGDAGGATVTAAGESSPPDRIRTNLLQWLAFISPSSLVVCHSHHTSAVWLRRAKTVDNVT